MSGRLGTPREAASSVASDTLSLFVLSVAQYSLAFAASALVSRTLGPAGRGIYYLPILGATTVLSFCKLGVDQDNIYQLGSRAVPLGKLSAQNTFVALTMGTIGCLVTVALRWMLPAQFSGTPLLFLLAAGLTIPLGIQSQLTEGLLALAGQPGAKYRAGITAAGFQIAIVSALIVAGALTPATALLATLLAGLVTCLTLVTTLARRVPVRPKRDWTLLRETMRGSLILHLGSLFLFLHLRLDMFMVETWIGVEALGLYSLSVVLAETLLLATESVALAILPGQVENTLEAAGERALRAARAVVLFGGVLAVGWAVLGRPILRLVFGEAYVGSYMPLLVLLPGIVLLGVQRVCGAPTLRAGRPALVAGISAVALACNALLNVFWIPRWGLVGASAASTVSYTLSTALFYAWTVRLAGAPFARALTPDRSDWQAAAQLLRSLRRMIRKDPKTAGQGAI